MFFLTSKIKNIEYCEYLLTLYKYDHSEGGCSYYRPLYVYCDNEWAVCDRSILYEMDDEKVNDCLFPIGDEDAFCKFREVCMCLE